MIEFQKKFIDDATDLIGNLEDNLLDLEQDKKDSSLIESVFRAMHTLKGSSGMFGFNKIEKMMHVLESIFDYIREGKLDITVEVINLSFEAIDVTKRVFNDQHLSDKKLKDKYFYVLNNINQFLNDAKAEMAPEPVVEEITSEEIIERQENSYYIYFYPDADVENRGVNLKGVFDELHQAGTLRIFPVTNPDYIKNESSTKFYLSWHIFLISELSLEDVEDIFMFVEYERNITLLIETNIFNYQAFIDEIERLSHVPDEIKKDALIEFAKNIVNGSLDKEDTSETEDEDKSLKLKSSSIKVSAEKLDELMNLVSELITKQSELNLYNEQNKNIKLSSISEGFQQLIRQLRNNALHIRLVPIETLTLQFKRLVRDLAVELDKDVELITEGADTELDKTIIDNLADPLLHIIRNSIDHGIENREIRLLKNKPQKGKISIKAEYEGGDVMLTIQDDGAGINLERVKTKAIEKGFIKSGEQLTDKGLLDLIVTPGFSTAEKVSEVSGRGVGMDVVAKKISDLRGRLDIQTERDIGTSITIKLPQTLSIIDTLLVEVADSFFILPLSIVDQCLAAQKSDMQKTENQHVKAEGELIPYISLRETFGEEKDIESKEKMVVIKIDDKKLAIIVDKVVGEHQAVIKPLGKMFKRQEYISGASMLGDGSLAFMLDINKLIKTI